MNFQRIISCLTLTLCLLLISGCTKKECTYELAEDYELNEIYFDLTFLEYSSDYFEDYVDIDLLMYALDEYGDKIPLMSKDLENIQIRYAGKSCDKIYAGFNLSCGEETLSLPDKPANNDNKYSCSVATRDIPENAVFTVSYQRGETTVWTSLRWPGLVSDIQIQGAANPDAWDPAVSLTEDMHISWNLPGEGQPEALRVNLDREAGTSEPPVPFFEETLSGDAAGIIIPKSVFADILASGSTAAVHLSVSSIVSGESSPLLAGAGSQFERTISKEITMLPCEADKIDTYFAESDQYFSQKFYCKSDESVNPDDGEESENK